MRHAGDNLWQNGLRIITNILNGCAFILLTQSYTSFSFSLSRSLSLSSSFKILLLFFSLTPSRSLSPVDARMQAYDCTCVRALWCIFLNGVASELNSTLRRPTNADSSKKERERSRASLLYMAYDTFLLYKRGTR
jgi:hypothetical protein